ncbi:MAG TPA: hypothetical protein VII58_07335 [Acidobacteriaceae bacterium]
MKDETKSRPELFLIPLLALFIVHPVIVHGCSCGHDFDFHLLSWFEAATQIGHGTLHPHWAYTPAWDAGEPRFVFYPPLSWYLGALLGLIFTHLPGVGEANAWTAVPIAFTWIALTLSGLTMFRLARRYASANASLIAATIYMASPYMLFTAYERTAYAELLAAAWMPLLLGGILRERISLPRIAVPIALLWLTNVPAAVMGCYALALLALMRILGICATRVYRQRTTDNGQGPPDLLGVALPITAGTALGLALAAFYILPAANERRYVQSAAALVGGTRIDANFLFQYNGPTLDDRMHDAVLRTASWIAVAMLATCGAALFAAWRRRPPSGWPSPVGQLALFTAVLGLMLTPLSAPLWHHAPEMAFLQFPWRLLALLAPVLALAIAVALSASLPTPATAPRRSFSPRAILATLLIAAALGLPAWHLFRQFCDPEDTAAARIALFHSSAGTDPTDEYTLATADNDALQPNRPLQPNDAPYWLAESPGASAPASSAMPATRTAPMHLVITAPRAEFLILNLRDYPAWRITLVRPGVAAQPATPRAPRTDGLMAIPVPTGRSTIDIRYLQTADQTAGDAISLIALAVLAALFARRGARRPAAMQPS